MRLSRRIERLFGGLFQRTRSGKKRRASHLENVTKIEDLGFTVLDLRGWHEGRYQPRRYHIVDKAGTVYDNDGIGFQSTKAALKAAIMASSGDIEPSKAVVGR